MKVTFNPNASQMIGTVSFATWSNRDLQEAIRRAFNERPNERIVEIEIQKDGIKARFEYEPMAVK